MNILYIACWHPLSSHFLSSAFRAFVNSPAIESTLFLTMRKVLILATYNILRRSRASAIRDCLADRAGRSC